MFQEKFTIPSLRNKRKCCSILNEQDEQITLNWPILAAGSNRKYILTRKENFRSFQTTSNLWNPRRIDKTPPKRHSPIVPSPHVSKIPTRLEN